MKPNLKKYLQVQLWAPRRCKNSCGRRISAANHSGYCSFCQKWDGKIQKLLTFRRQERQGVLARASAAVARLVAEARPPACVDFAPPGALAGVLTSLDHHRCRQCGLAGFGHSVCAGR